MIVCLFACLIVYVYMLVVACMRVCLCAGVRGFVVVGGVCACLSGCLFVRVFA